MEDIVPFLSHEPLLRLTLDKWVSAHFLKLVVAYY